MISAPDASDRRANRELSRFRQQVYESLNRRADALFELGGYTGVPARFEGTERDIFLARLTGDVLAELRGLVPEVYEVHLAPRVRLVEALLQGEESAVPPVAVDPLPEDAPIVAVHDTGTSPTHPYLAPVLAGTGSVVPGEPDPVDRDGHGTAMSGIATYPGYLQDIVAGQVRPQTGSSGCG